MMYKMARVCQWLGRRQLHVDHRPFAPALPGLERLEPRRLLDSGATLTPSDVAILLDRAARATASDSAIVAVVDRLGRPLGIRVEGGVSPSITGNAEKLVFAVDGALAKARTGAFFANNQAPLTSRTIQDISQSTMTQREVQSDPNLPPSSASSGPGFVAPIGQKGHFPPRVPFTPQVDLSQIEQTNRDSILHTGLNGDRSDLSTDILLPARFNADPAYIPAGQEIAAPESYGLVSGILPLAQARGISTLPGGVPLYKDGNLSGGIGVFFPGTTGFATEENSGLNDAGFFDPRRPDLSAEAEYIAFVAAGGSKAAGYSFNTPKINSRLGLEPLPGFDLPFGRIDLVGITLDIFGAGGLQGPRNLVSNSRAYGVGNSHSGSNLPVDTQGDTLLGGRNVPDGWLVVPHASADGTVSAADVTSMVQRGIAEAQRVRAAIRLPLDSTASLIRSSSVG